MAAKPCPPSADSVSEIDSCPMTLSEWKQRELKKDCSTYNQTCSGRKLQYHCLLNPYGNKSLEVCAPRTLVGNASCPVYSEKEKIIRDEFFCTELFPECPKKPYNSTEIINYPGCLKEGYGSTTPVPTPTSSDNDMPVSILPDDSTTEDNIISWLIPVVILIICIAVAVSIIYWMKRKKKGCFKEDEELGKDEDKDNSNQRTPLLDPTNANNESVKNTNEEIVEERVDNQGTSTEKQQDEGIHDSDQKTPQPDLLNTKESLKETNDSKNEIEMDNLKPSTEPQQDDKNKNNSSQETPKPDDGKADITADDSGLAAEDHQATEAKNESDEDDEGIEKDCTESGTRIWTPKQECQILEIFSMITDQQKSIELLKEEIRKVEREKEDMKQTIKQLEDTIRAEQKSETEEHLRLQAELEETIKKLTQRDTQLENLKKELVAKK